MRRSRPIGTMVLMLATTLSLSVRATGQPSDSRSLIGTWRLVSLEEPTADVTVAPIDSTGLLIFTADGHMSVQVMYRSAQIGGSAGPVQYAQGGYEASFGRYSVSRDARTFTFEVEGALVRTLVSQHLERRFTRSGSQLTVTPVNPKEHWRVVWEQVSV